MKNRQQFITLFSLENVEILTSIPTTQVFIGENGVEELKVPMIITGFVMDADDDFIYLSPDGENVNQAVPFNIIQHVQVITEQDKLTALLDEMGEPESGEFN